MKITINNIDNLMYNAVFIKDESAIKNLIIASIDFFLSDKNFTLSNLDQIASLYLQVPIEEKWPEEFVFKNNKLRYVLEELSAIGEKDVKNAKIIAQRCKLYLEGKNYEI